MYLSLLSSPDCGSPGLEPVRRLAHWYPQLCNKRYYYYAHLRQNYPYAEGLEEGSVVTAGDVIGYMGHTGYSTTENVNNIEVTHLHWGLELVFDEEQKESDNEIWIDVYPLTCFRQNTRRKCRKSREQESGSALQKSGNSDF